MNFIEEYVKIKIFLTCNAFWRHWKIEFNQYQKFYKASFISHADLECLIEKIDGAGEQILSDFPMATMSSFKRIKNKHDYTEVKNAGGNFMNSSESMQ